MDISLPALVSILALVILVGISCVNEDLNVGFLGIAFGIIVGGIFSNITAAKIMNAFPLSLYCPCTVNHLYSLHFRNHYRPWQYRRLRTYGSCIHGYCF